MNRKQALFVITIIAIPVIVGIVDPEIGHAQITLFKLWVLPMLIGLGVAGLIIAVYKRLGN